MQYRRVDNTHPRISRHALWLQVFTGNGNLDGSVARFAKGAAPRLGGNLFALYARCRAVIAESTGKVATRSVRATRQSLGWATPAERLDQLLAVCCTQLVDTTPSWVPPTP
jgi:hypothetical protein